MSRTAVIVAGISLALLGFGRAAGTVPLPPGYSVAETSAVHPGVRYERVVKRARPILAHVAHIEPGAAVDLRVVNGRDKVPNRFTDLETTGSMCQRVQCLVAVNGDFHYENQPVGGMVVGGRMLRSPDPGHPQLTVDGDGRLSAGELPWTGSLLLSNGTRVPLAGVNVPPRDGVVLYTAEWGAHTAAPGRIEVVVATPTPAGLVNQPTPARLQERRAVPGPIPPGSAVLSASGAAAEALDRAWKDVGRKAITPQARILVETSVDAAESLGANPVILRNGKRALPWPADPNLIPALHPRTLVGWNPAGDRFIVAVDGRQPSSAGLTMAEAADFLLGLGATDAVNLDGGGGTTFVVGGAVRNRPSDHPEQNPPPERVAPNALVVLARPAIDVMADDGNISPAPSNAAPDSGPLGGEPPAGSTWSEGDVEALVADPALGQNGQGDAPGPDAPPIGDFRVATVPEGAERGDLRPAPGGAAPPHERTASGRGRSTTGRESDDRRPDETARGMAPETAVALPRPLEARPSLAGHAATRVAGALLILQWAGLATAVRRRRAPALRS